MDPLPDTQHRRPRWMSVALVLALLVVATLIVAHLTVGGLGGDLPGGGH